MTGLARDDLPRASLELIEVAGLAGPVGAAAENPLVGEEREQRDRADADLDRPGPRLPGDEALDDAADEQRQGEPDGDSHEGAAALRERGGAALLARHDPGPEDRETRRTG